jgi:hypothetical protein
MSLTLLAAISIPCDISSAFLKVNFGVSASKRR